MTVSSLQFRPLPVPTSSKVNFGQEISNIDLEHLSGESHLNTNMDHDFNT